MNTTEREFLAAAIAGDRQAFDQLCQIYRQEIFALCFRFLKDQEDTHDIVQETFSRAWQYLESYRQEASLRTWLWEIARNRCLNHLRARKSQIHQHTIALEAQPEEALAVVDTRPTPESVLVEAAHQAQIRQEIARCAAEKRWEPTDWDLFLLRIEKEMSYAEFVQRHGRDEAYWRNRWRDKIKPVLERVRERMTNRSV